MGLWVSFGHGFQRENLIPKIPTIPKTHRKVGQETNSRDFRDSRDKVSILKKGSVDPLDLPDSEEAIAWATHVWGLADHDVNIRALLLWDIWLRLKDEQLVLEPMGRLRPDELASVRRWLKLRDSRGVTREAHVVQTLQTGIPWQGDDLPMTPPFEMKQARRFFDTLKRAA